MKKHSVDLPVKVQKKHVVLLILSRVLVLFSLLGALDLLEILLRPVDPSPPADGGTGMDWPGALLGEAVQGFTLFVLLAAWIPCLCMGAILAVLLVMNRNDKPGWLWTASLGLAIAFGLIAAGTLVAWILV